MNVSTIGQLISLLESIPADTPIVLDKWWVDFYRQSQLGERETVVQLEFRGFFGAKTMQLPREPESQKQHDREQQSPTKRPELPSPCEPR